MRVVEILASLAQQFIAGIAPPAAFFALLAVAVKRRAIGAAIQRARPEFSTNAALLIINTLLLTPIMLIPIGAVHSLFAVHPALAAFWEQLPAALTVFLAVLVYDFTAYWRHRLEHSPSLWRYHATHHADTAMSWLTVSRKHPVAKFLSLLVDTMILLALGVPVWAVAAAGLIRSWWGYFIHCDVPWTLGPLGRVLISPAAHRLHHIRDEELMGSNYGNTVTIWDRLFGTWVDPTPYVDCETGIAEGTRGVWGELKRPWEARYRTTDEEQVDEAIA